MNTTQNLKAQMTATARAFESLLTVKVTFSQRVAIRSQYLDKLAAHKHEAAKLGLTDVENLLTEARSDVTTATSPRLVLTAAESL